MSPLRGRISGKLLRTGQTTVYAARDDADILAGRAKSYQVLTAGQFSLTTAVYLPCLALNDIAFVNATSKITAAAGLDVVKTGDVIRIRGSAGNETEYTVQTGSVATEIVLTTQPAEEGSGAWITIAKQALQSNNCVMDLMTGLMWLRYGTYSPAKLGAASDGKLLWTATAVTIHAANADLQMVAGGKGLCTVKIIGGAGEVLRYWPGYTYSYTGFTNAVNKLPGFRCVSVTVNGADLDIVMATGNRTCIAEAAGVNGAINLSVNDIWSFANACIAAAVGGYSDWRVANFNERILLSEHEVLYAVPDTTAFPDVPINVWHWAATTKQPDTTMAIQVGRWSDVYRLPKTDAYLVMLVRGGL